METTDHTAVLDLIAARLERLGYVVARRSFFASDGLLVHTPRRNGSSSDPITVLEKGVMLYPVASGWQARVTPHGAPHWIHDAPTPDALFELAVAALQSNDPIPVGWTLAPP